MPRYKVRIEYAMAFDLDIEVEASDRYAAVGSAQGVADEAGLWSAIREQFAGCNPEFAAGDMEITDVRVVNTLRRARQNVA